MVFVFLLPLYFHVFHGFKVSENMICAASLIVNGVIVFNLAALALVIDLRGGKSIFLSNWFRLIFCITSTTRFNLEEAPVTKVKFLYSP